MVERFPTILWDKGHMILAVPLGMTESFAVWHDKLPLGGTLSGSPKGVCRLDSRNCQTLGVPRQSRGFTMIKLDHKISVDIKLLTPSLTPVLVSRPRSQSRLPLLASIPSRGC